MKRMITMSGHYVRHIAEMGAQHRVAAPWGVRLNRSAAGCPLRWQHQLLVLA